MRLRLVLLLALAALIPAPANASPNARFGIQDDAWLMSGPGTTAQRIATLRRLGVGMVRFTLRWDAVASSRPANARNPADPAYHWESFDAILQPLHAAG